jgi:cell division septum initiation protein DivIVA
VAKVTSAKPGDTAPSGRAAGSSARNKAGTAAQKPASTERNATKIVASAQQEAVRLRAEAKADAARIRQEAEEHAHRLVLDARAAADGVRAEGMEVVSNLRQISDTLRETSVRVLQDVEAIHARMIGELERAEDSATGLAPAEPDAPVQVDAPADPRAADQLDVPDFLARS